MRTATPAPLPHTTDRLRLHSSCDRAPPSWQLVLGWAQQHHDRPSITSVLGKRPQAPMTVCPDAMGRAAPSPSLSVPTPGCASTAGRDLSTAPRHGAPRLPSRSASGAAACIPPRPGGARRLSP